MKRLHIGIVAAVHGDEPLGTQIIRDLRIPHGVRLTTLIAHPEALAKDVRYLETDLNRSFPGKEEGSKEERIATRILKALASCDVVFDLHTTTAMTESFVIATRHTSLASHVPLRYAVHMTPTCASGRALIDHVPGVSIEFQERIAREEAKQIVEGAIISVVENMHHMQEQFAVEGTVKTEKEMVNFREGIFEGKRFIPILAGERAYMGMCLRAKRIESTDERRASLPHSNPSPDQKGAPANSCEGT